MELNPIQKQVAELYEAGEFAHLDAEDCEDCGDTLFTFCIREAGDDCESVLTFVNRLDTAIRQLQNLSDDLLLRELDKEC